MMKNSNRLWTIWLFCLLPFVLLACKPRKSIKSQSVRQVMDHVVTRLYGTVDPVELDTISDQFIERFLTDEEREVLATRFWTFDVNVRTRVSLMRDTAQENVPFWLEDAGFEKTNLLVKNDEYTYEVWQKDFEPGRIELGINGFDKHRPVYFICAAPVKAEDKLEITEVYPAEYALSVMKKGAFTYHDWDSLILTEVPASLDGQTLFTTVRGRAREAHLVGAFRKSATPSSEQPDQLLQTWSGDPHTTMDIQWRTSRNVPEGVVRYWESGSGDTLEQHAAMYVMEDRLLQNDRYIHRFTARLTGLSPGKNYQYMAGRPGNWSGVAGFTTEPAGKDDFSFVWFGDTHHSKIWGDMARKVYGRHPDASFYSIAGDLVSTGLHRDEWDELWDFSGNVFRNRPLMPVPGNHDSQDGLGAWMYQEMFSLPGNGPVGLPREMTYSFVYQNALFLMIDCTLPVDAQTAWIEEKLSTSDAAWKFVMFHFPPYNFVEPYPDIVREWCSLFDKYHVDIVMSGHMHYYLRTKPINNGKTMDTPAEGTIYTMSISIPGKQEEWPEEPYSVTRYPDGPLYQYVEIKGKSLVFTSMDPDGNVKDRFEIEK